jgi:REP element-mobilizing transposase RayT
VGIVMDFRHEVKIGAVMILAYHVILTNYGFWLPNDPRGSGSMVLRAMKFLPYGPASKVEGERSVAGVTDDRKARKLAKEILSYPPVVFTGLQARSVGLGFGDVVTRTGCVVHACSVLPDHAHLVIARNRYGIEKLIPLLKGGATHRLLEEDLHPFGPLQPNHKSLPKVFARGGRHRFLDSEEAIVRAIRYVKNNPVKQGLPRQRWSFVTPYPGVR